MRRARCDDAPFNLRVAPFSLDSLGGRDPPVRSLRSFALARAHGMCTSRITRIRKGKMIHCTILDPNTMLCIINYLIFWRTSFLLSRLSYYKPSALFRGDIDCDSFCLDFASMLHLIINTTVDGLLDVRNCKSRSTFTLSLLIMYISIYTDSPSADKII